MKKKEIKNPLKKMEMQMGKFIFDNDDTKSEVILTETNNKEQHIDKSTVKQQLLKLMQELKNKQIYFVA